MTVPAGPPNFDYSWGTTRRRDGTVSDLNPGFCLLTAPESSQQSAFGLAPLTVGL